MKRLFRWICSWFKLYKKVEQKVEYKESEFKLVSIPSESVTEMAFGEKHTFLAPFPLVNLEGKLIAAVNHGDKMLRRIVKVERPPIEGAIWTAVIETIGAPPGRSLIVIPFDSLVRGYRLVEATKKEERIYARTERPGNW